MAVGKSAPWGYRWRSSQSFIITTATISLFSEAFLFGFIVPILPYMLETRLHLDPSQTQNFTTTLLTVYGVVSLVSAPFFAHFADKTPSRKVPLLLSLAACASGTVLVACAPTVWLLMTGQILQSLASSSVWIVAFATLADNVGEGNKGKVLGTAMSFVGTGIFAGPMVSGALLQLLGYWPAWSAALLLLAVDVVARLLMIEVNPTSTEGTEQTDERTALLDGENGPTSDAGKALPARGFYRIMLTNAQILAGIFNTLIFSVIISAFDTTLPLHVRDLFGWESLPVGIIFLGLQVPSILFGPAIGSLRDRVGLRWPTVIGWGFIVPLIWLLGVPGADLPWGRLEHGGQVVYIIAVVGLGFAFALLRGAGTFQMMAVVHELEAKDPNIFGPYGGNSRLSSLTELPFNIGMIAGPLLSGSISETIGYYWMNTALAVLALLVTISSYLYLTAAPKSDGDEEV
ncbi:major facilitator superfamily domain-containing protein [Aspergillus granulosus]|uniref:Major facilitator superfamily domain-containing protein n=1 Tax=Aspergillus granulosus TaxID=176169 RepID=A0ABR4HC26_9EURO